MDVIYERNGKWQGVLKRWSLDISIGEDDDFELTMPIDASIGVDGSRVPWYGDYVFIPRTEYGGVVDTVSIDTEAGEIAFSGRTWRGILSNKVIKPDAGHDYLTVSGSIEECMYAVISRAGLEGAFTVAGSSGVNVKSYKFARYVNATEGLTALLDAHGLCLRIEKRQSACVLSAVPKAVYSDGVDDNFIDYAMTSGRRPVNHLVCLGEGELKDRVVVHLYADANGNVSETKTFTGVDEVEVVYDSNNKDAAGLREDGTKKLLEYQQDAVAVDLALSDEMRPTIGDEISTSSVAIGITATAKICRIVIKLDYGGQPSVDYTVGSVKLR